MTQHLNTINLLGTNITIDIIFVTPTSVVLELPQSIIDTLDTNPLNYSIQVQYSTPTTINIGEAYKADYNNISNGNKTNE